MHNPNLDKRMDALLKTQTAEHRHLIENHHKEMQDLRDALNSAMQRFDALYEDSEVQMKDLSLFVNQNVVSNKDKISALEFKYSMLKERTENIVMQLLDFHDDFTRKSDMENLQKECDSKIHESKKEFSNLCDQGDRKLNSLFGDLNQELMKLRKEMSDCFFNVNESLESKFCVSQLQGSGILKEIRTWEKTIFIIEKKIENIYTLIDRLKRGDPCRKPE
jgi:chromosome segregation ATPase